MIENAKQVAARLHNLADEGPRPIRDLIPADSSGIQWRQMTVGMPWGDDVVSLLFSRQDDGKLHLYVGDSDNDVQPEVVVHYARPLDPDRDTR